ncbi:MAG TPA: GDP-mannose 4,6-dehydratase [Candidatus Saccharimonadales bacterium]|nr:GDP-mannose 4,6-dehydratase [Candidatus Saccharimonadales bacterium]
MKALITGINGFIGSYLSEHLSQNGYIVEGTSRQKINLKNYKVYQSALGNLEEIANLITKSKPDVIFHLAAQSNIPYSFTHPQETLEANTITTVNFLEYLRERKSKTVFISIGSSSEYGHSTKKLLTESSSLNPSSPYAISKLAQSHFVDYYRKSFEIKAVHVRPFAIVGPGKKGDAISDFARGIVAIEKGQQVKLLVGDLSHSRDFLDVRDCVSALGLIAEKPLSPSYNICSGKGIKLEDLLSKLITFSSAKVVVEKDPEKTRPSDDHIIIGNSAKLKALGFKPQIQIDQTLSDILDYWRNHN